MWQYLYSGKKNVQGWLQAVDAEIIGHLLHYQGANGIVGHLAEIGVHHGKLFIALCLARQADEKAICIDLFDNQALNLDNSGKGSKHHLLINLETYCGNTHDVEIIANDSTQVTSEDIRSFGEPIRFFSIDGGHWKDVVISDLTLAESVLSADGIVALDDYCRSDWPEVTVGLSVWLESTHSDLVPFANGTNKLYLCRLPKQEQYRNVLKSSPVAHYLTKTYSGTQMTVDSYRLEPVQREESSFLSAIKQGTHIFRPALFRYLKSFVNR
jgi:hypothetical protein